MNAFISCLRNYGPLAEDAENDINGKLRYVTKRKDDFFLKQGQSTSSLLVMEKGLIRAFFNKGNKEYNTWFAKENEIVASILPLFSNKPSFENIQFLEDSTGYLISINDLNKIYKKYPECDTIGRRLAEELCIVLEGRITSLHTESAEERYHSLIRQYPYLLQRLTLGHIASFLGITQETLSRIRKR